jgi:hypothetical protein
MLEASPSHLVRLPRDTRVGLAFYRLICPQPGCDWVTMVTRDAGGIVEADGHVRFEKIVCCAKCGNDVKVNQCAIAETSRVRSCCRS